MNDFHSLLEAFRDAYLWLLEGIVHADDCAALTYCRELIEQAMQDISQGIQVAQTDSSADWTYVAELATFKNYYLRDLINLAEEKESQIWGF